MLCALTKEGATPGVSMPGLGPGTGGELLMGTPHGVSKTALVGWCQKLSPRLSYRKGV